MIDAMFRYVGSLDGLTAMPDVRRSLLERTAGGTSPVRATTLSILERVRSEGDGALYALARELDGVELATIEVSRRTRRRALDALAAPLRRAMERAARNIETVHRAFLPRPIEVQTEPGIVVGRRPDALRAVGVYAPGGRAAYPSSVLMGVVPARAAGVGTVVLCSPPGRDGVPSDVVLAAAEIAGVDAVFSVGGAGAIAAMAYGTESIPRVQRIVGPGNAYVAEAKLQVQASGTVGIDSPAGPSELLVIADRTADPVLVAREMVAQAEHDPLSAVIAVADEETAARAISAAIELAVPAEAREAIVRQALRARGAVIWASTLRDAVDFAAEFAPEHLLLAGDRSAALLPELRNAGTVFVGEASSVAFGDYMTGANHVLPTGGAARSYSGLSTSDFIRWTTYQRVTPQAAAGLARDVALLAEAEQLPAHAVAARAWGPGR
jgi:histidinol dehydrogenase